jgi:hypothetical protein
MRGIKSDEAKSILETEITHLLSTKERIIQALFVLARYRENSLSDEQFRDIINSDYMRRMKFMFNLF